MIGKTRYTKVSVSFAERRKMIANSFIPGQLGVTVLPLFTPGPLRLLGDAKFPPRLSQFKVERSGFLAQPRSCAIAAADGSSQYKQHFLHIAGWLIQNMRVLSYVCGVG
jgi:hypothetical protein